MLSSKQVQKWLDDSIKEVRRIDDLIQLIESYFEDWDDAKYVDTKQSYIDELAELEEELLEAQYEVGDHQEMLKQIIEKEKDNGNA